MRRRAAGLLAIGVAGVTVLLALGVWQVQRLAWKTAILDLVEGRLAEEPAPVPPDPRPETDEYRRVRTAGTLEPGELHVYTSFPPHGVGYRVIAPFRLADGRRILLDRGFVPIEAKDAQRPLGPVEVEGVLRWPQETDRFTSDPDLEENIWFAREVPAMAEALGTLPVMLVVSASDDPAAPLPTPATVAIPNDHLGYAITWFCLAAVWAVMTGYALWRIKRRID